MPATPAPKTICTQVWHSPCGDLLLGSLGDRLCLCDWTNRRNVSAILSRLKRCSHADIIEQNSSVIDLAVSQLDEYFHSTRRTFSVPLLLAGTSFQQAVWAALQGIPYGTTVTYLQLAERINCPQSVRAVANAVGANAMSIFVPCHRIIGTNGTLTGYAGGLPAKRFLLQLESSRAAML